MSSIGGLIPAKDAPAAAGKGSIGNRLETTAIRPSSPALTGTGAPATSTRSPRHFSRSWSPFAWALSLGVAITVPLPTIAAADASTIGESPLQGDDLKELESVLAEVPSIWNRTVEAGLWSGYNDNLLQDAARSEESFLLGASVEAMLLRLPLDRRQVSIVLSGEFIEYPEGRRVDHEAFAAAFSEVKWDLAHGWQPALGLDYLFLEQVIDTSITETNLSSTLIRAHGLAARPSLTKAFSEKSSWSVAANAHRHWYDEPFDDFWETGAKLTWQTLYGQRSSVTLSYEWNVWLYDTRPEVALDGTPRPGTSLQFHVHETELAWRHHWDEAQRWRTISRFNFRANQDSSAGGYFDYQRVQFRQELRYTPAKWDLRANFRVGYYDFSQQRTGVTNGPKRSRTRLGGGVRAERVLTSHLRLFGDYACEDVDSNRTVDEYRVNKVTAGLLYGF